MTNNFFSNELYSDFIEDFENNWLQYATSNEKMKAYFGNEENAKSLYKKWKNGEDIWALRKEILWTWDKKSHQN